VNDAPEARFVELATEALKTSQLDSSVPPEVAAAAEDGATAVSAVLAIAGAAKEKLAHWTEQQKQGLVPAEGALIQRQQVRDKALQLARDADRSFNAAHDAAVEAVTTAALPKLPENRELLARQELDVVLGGAEGSSAKARILAAAQNGSDDVRAILATPYARQRLISAGVSSVDDTLSTLKRVIASTDKAAQANLEKLENLSGAYLAAGSAFRHSLGEE
jgi:hypothetical protein